MTVTLPQVAPVETVTKPKPSEMVRLGSIGTKQGYHHYCNVENNTYCAVGAMMKAVGFPVETATPAGMYGFLQDYSLWKSADYPCGHCSISGGRTSSIFVITTHLNDEDKWSREKIADWLDSIGY